MLSTGVSATGNTSSVLATNPQELAMGMDGLLEIPLPLELGVVWVAATCTCSFSNLQKTKTRKSWKNSLLKPTPSQFWVL